MTQPNRFALSLAVLSTGSAIPASTTTQPTADDCSLTYGGSYRAAVKNRLVSDGMNYIAANGGQPLDLPAWYALMDQFDPRVPGKPRTNTPALPGLETVRVTLRGYLVGVKWETGAGGDNDFHCEIAGAPQWQGDHVVVEVGPGPAYCSVRQAVWGLVKRDQGRAPGVKTILRHPPAVLVTGYVFLDGTHARAGTAHYADAVGKDAGRGITGPEHSRQVRGLWEIHPVLGVVVGQ